MCILSLVRQSILLNNTPYKQEASILKCIYKLSMRQKMKIQNPHSS